MIAPVDITGVRLETERLILRPFTMEDAEPMFRNWASDDEVTKHLTWPTHESVEITNMVLSDWTGHYPEPDFYNWAIVLKENGPEPIGSIGVVKKLQELIDTQEPGKYLRGVDTMFRNFPAVTLTEKQEKRCRNGNSFTLDAAPGTYRAYSESGEFLMLAKVEDGVMSTIKSFFEV